MLQLKSYLFKLTQGQALKSYKTFVTQRNAKNRNKQLEKKHRK